MSQGFTNKVEKADINLDNVTNDAQVKKIASSTDNAVMRWDGTSGDTPQDSQATIDDNGSINIPSGQTYKINGAALSKSDVGLGNVPNSDHTAQGYITSAGVTFENLNTNEDVGTGASQVAAGNHAHAESEITFTDITTNNVSTSKHGFVPKAPDDSQKYLDGTGGWTSLTLNKLDATAAPTTGDDTGDGYSVGSVWVDVTNDKAYICVDASSGAAVWNFIGGEKIAAHVSLSSSQSSNLAADNQIEFDTLDLVSGSGVTLSTGSGQENGIVTLPSDKTFLVFGAIYAGYSASSGWAYFELRNNSNDSAFHSYGTNAISWSNQKAINMSLQPVFSSIIDTSGGSVSFKVDVQSMASLNEIGYQGTFMVIQEV